jgi:ABC-2 type transport system permease protein
MSFMQRIQNTLRLRGVRYGANASAMTILFIAIMVFSNVLAVRFHTRYDLTAQKEFSISQQTKQILQKLTQPVEIIGFYNGQDAALQADLESRLKEYRSVSAQVSYRFVDPDRDPVTASAENITTYGTVVFKSGGSRQIINAIDEKDITGAILKVSATTKTKVFFVTGHRERPIDTTDPTGLGDVKQLLEADNLIVEPINLVISATIPLENTVLVVADPLDAMQPSEEAAIQQYLDQGGRMVLLSNTLSPAPLASAMAQWGLVWKNDLVLDEQSQVGNPVAPAVLEYPYSDITKDLAGQASVFNSVRTIGTLAEEFPEGYTVDALLNSSDNSMAATKFDAGKVETQESDEKGPLTFGYTVETPAKARVVVVGDVDFVTNGFLKVTQANAPLFRNMVAWAAAQEELISVPTQEPVDRQVFITESQANIIFYSCVIGLPLLFLLTGVAVWWRRR